MRDRSAQNDIYIYIKHIKNDPTTPATCGGTGSSVSYPISFHMSRKLNNNNYRSNANMNRCKVGLKVTPTTTEKLTLIVLRLRGSPCA